MSILIQFRKRRILEEILAKTTFACILCALRLLFVFIPFTDELGISNFQKVILQINPYSYL
ncbi:exported hypothetical protein [Agrobacterium genomosp. 13 str. CFBP 6927]|uniref:Uncharacterized protein n=1 Tax=Agrobacterium genomosp. 13 str. CFBP 6927 TaxID=1183428 RepID=A0ABP2BFC1_9HYPH|nr:exported hypothetical protein [Agrobacterium genomosp. 13 str. CFBP 6927]